ncbi:MAG TPA: hypothetical protein VFI31_17175 [Pirellulales bacterium]|nr:hypothetical protein [Pirellulales bacterium]
MDDVEINGLQTRARWCEVGLLVVAAVIAAGSARDYAGGWNDGSRLATVESLVDRHTLAIDDSIFVRSAETADAPNPYTPGDELLRLKGTQDKLFIGGHYYSDKSPLPAFWLAAWYQVLKWLTGLSVREHPRLFCYSMTLVSSGMAYIAGVWSVWRLALRKQLPLHACLLLAASLATATVALPYTRHVNNHVLLLAAVALLLLVLDRLTVRYRRVGFAHHDVPGHDVHDVQRSARERLFPILAVMTAGALAGLGYSFDLGLGPVLLLSTAGLVAYRTRSVLAMFFFSLGAFPWLAAHHAVNYYTGATLGPANSVPEYLAWPGSPFSAQNMTGGWAHGGLGHFLLYAAALLFGKHGFVNYNLPVLLALVSLAPLFRRRIAELPEIAFAAALSGGSWLLYAALSNNYSGPCCSIRWFVPLLAPAYYLLILALRERPALMRDLALLSLYGAMLSAYLWFRGPWDGRVPVMLWPINAVALISWLLIKAKSRSVQSGFEVGQPQPRRNKAA